MVRFADCVTRISTQKGSFVKRSNVNPTEEVIRYYISNARFTSPLTRAEIKEMSRIPFVPDGREVKPRINKDFEWVNPDEIAAVYNSVKESILFGKKPTIPTSLFADASRYGKY